MSRRSTAVSAIAVLGLLTVCLTGCASVSPPRCLPAALNVSLTSVTAGGSVTVSSPAADCALGYQEGHTYSIRLSSQAVIARLFTASVGGDGSFSKVIPIPANFPRGTAYILVTGSPYDNCEDGGSCAGYSTSITVE
jgi:hypothetical protein